MSYEAISVEREGVSDALRMQRNISEMLAATPLGLRLTKECLNASLDAGSLEAVIALEDRNQVLCVQSADFREGVRAFLEKRKPDYADR
jgi:enoyl-CoA hydratase